MCAQEKSTVAGKESAGDAIKRIVEIITSTVREELKFAEDGDAALMLSYETLDVPPLPFTALIELITAEDTNLVMFDGLPLLSRHETAGILYRSATEESKRRFLNYARSTEQGIVWFEHALNEAGQSKKHCPPK